MNRIEGKVAIVTGGTQDLARLLSGFSRRPARWALSLSGAASKGQVVAKGITDATGVPVEMIAADLANIDDVRGIVPAADRYFGRVDILVNAAGLTDRGNLLNTSPELFDHMFAVNTRAPFF